MDEAIDGCIGRIVSRTVQICEILAFLPVFQLLSAQGAFKPEHLLRGIAGDGVQEIGEVAGGGGEVGDFQLQMGLVPGAGEEEFFGGVQLRVTGKVAPGLEVLIQQVVVEEGLIAFVGEVGLDDGLEEGGVFAREKEAEFVAGVFAVEGAFGGIVESGPGAEEGELGQCGIFAQVEEQIPGVVEVAVSLETRTEGVLEGERDVFFQNGDGVLLGEVAGGVEAFGQTEISNLEGFVRKGEIPHRGGVA